MKTTFLTLGAVASLLGTAALAQTANEKAQADYQAKQAQYQAEKAQSDAGQAQYQVFIYSETLKELNKTLLKLNQEAAASAKKNQPAKEGSNEQPA